jgi:hypothetical protein
MKRLIMVAVAILICLAAWLLSGCVQSGQVVETNTGIPATPAIKSGIIQTPAEPYQAAAPESNSKADEDDADTPGDSSRGYIDVDQSGGFSEGDILLESNGEKSYFLPQEYLSDTET